jgi:large subunit ribosomal protein L7/L12
MATEDNVNTKRVSALVNHLQHATVAELQEASHVLAGITSPTVVRSIIDTMLAAVDDKATKFQVNLLSGIRRGDNQIKVIKIIREYGGYGLKEAKELSDSAPTELLVTDDEQRATNFLRDLKAAGAEANVRHV